MNILDFIDSEYVRSHNADTCFTDAQKAKLICLSHNKSVHSKISAMKALAENIPKDTDFYSSMLKTIENWENALKKTSNSTNAFFTANFYESGEEIREREEVFSHFQYALEYITEHKYNYSESDCFSDIPTYAIINRRVSDSDEYIHYTFNDEMTLFDVSGAFKNLSKHFEDIPLPFKDGDIVVGFNPVEGDYFGVFSYTDCGTRLDTYDNRGKKFSSIMNPVCTELSLCNKNELPEELKILRLISEVRKGESDFYNLLYAFSADEVDDYL